MTSEWLWSWWPQKDEPPPPPGYWQQMTSWLGYSGGSATSTRTVSRARSTANNTGGTMTLARNVPPTVRLKKACRHGASPIYGCQSCLIPALPDLQHPSVAPLLQQQQHALNFNQSGGGTLKWPLAPLLSATPFASAKEYRVVIPAHGQRIPHDQISARSYYWGYALYFPRPVLDHLYNATNVLLAATGMMSSASLLLAAPFLALFVGPLASYLILENALIKSVDKGHGVMICASWAMPIVFWPQPLRAPEIEVISKIREVDSHSSAHSGTAKIVEWDLNMESMAAFWNSTSSSSEASASSASFPRQPPIQILQLDDDPEEQGTPLSGRFQPRRPSPLQQAISFSARDALYPLRRAKTGNSAKTAAPPSTSYYATLRNRFGARREPSTRSQQSAWNHNRDLKTHLTAPMSLTVMALVACTYFAMFYRGFSSK